MKLCPWCNNEYPEEFFEEHHINHIHEDDSPENKIIICVKCHKRHHRESGYDTIIVKKNLFVPKTLMEEMVSIERDVFLQEYRKRATRKMDRQVGIFFGENPETYKVISDWIDGNAKTILDVRHSDNNMMKKVDLVPK